MQEQTISSGSQWNKWDLHIHTPLSFHWNQGKKFSTQNPKEKEQTFQDIYESIQQSECVGFAIMDYWTFDGYMFLRNYLKEKKLPLNKCIIPGIELRIEAPTNYRLNVHALLSDKVTEQQLNDFKSKLEIRIGANTRSLSNEAIIEFAKNISPDIAQKHGKNPPAQLSPEELLELGCTTVEVTRDSLLQAKACLPDGFCFIYMPWDTSDGLSKLDWAVHSASAKSLLEIIDIAESRNKDIRKVFINERTPQNEHFIENFQQGLGYKPKPVVCGSDAHKLSDYGNFPSNKATWIKAESTFEGFKQILFEPQTRSIIQEFIPTVPVNRLQWVDISLPEETLIYRKSDGKKTLNKSPFCLRGKHHVPLNPYFTCFIGGRGTGKSTILNIIAEKLSKENDFFEENSLEGLENPFKEYITIEGTPTIEYVSQNKIEDLAGKGELTATIYSRVKDKNNTEKFKDLEEKIQKGLETIDEHIDLIKTNQKLLNERDIINTQLIGAKKIIDSNEHPTFKKLTDDSGKKNEELQKVLSTKNNHSELIEALNTKILQRFSLDKKAENDYEKSIERILAGIKTIIDVEKETSIDVSELTKEVEGIAKKIDTFLQKRGVNDEDIAEYESALKNKPIYETEIQNSNKSLADNKTKMGEALQTEQKFTMWKKSFETLLTQELQPLNKELSAIQNDQVEEIEFSYLFDHPAAEEHLFDLFERTFEDLKPSELRSKSDSMRQYLFCVRPDEVSDYKTYFEKLHNWGEDVNAKKILVALFEKPSNFEIYKLLIKRVKLDVLSYKQIESRYGGKALQNCSFGQRCTAVIVALILFGNKPLLIDEPEAHLDSKLIATFLVDLIKKRKAKRQIIFATHNANFVVNGDAELINILSLDTDGKTIITPTTIENLEHRETLLNLEGGREAFKKRDDKLIS